MANRHQKPMAVRRAFKSLPTKKMQIKCISIEWLRRRNNARSTDSGVQRSRGYKLSTNVDATATHKLGELALASGSEILFYFVLIGQHVFIVAAASRDVAARYRETGETPSLDFNICYVTTYSAKCVSGFYSARLEQKHFANLIISSSPNFGVSIHYTPKLYKNSVTET